MKKLADVLVDTKFGHKQISLSKLTGQPITDILGFMTSRGEPVFEIANIVLADGTVLFVDGEHEAAYLEVLGDAEQHEGLDQETLDSLYAEQDGEDETEDED
jgi:hypothetical protein